MWKRLFSLDPDPSADPAARAVRASLPVEIDDEPRRGDTAVFSSWRPLIRGRLALVVGLLAVWAVAIEVRLVFLQVVHAADYRERALNQQQRTQRPKGLRGDIIDRDGRLLAYSVQGYAIESDPGVIDNAADTVRRLCAALGDCTAQERRDLTARLDGAGVWAPIRKARQVSPAQAGRVKAAELPGIIVLPEAQRFYPNLELASQVIGFVGSEHEGRSGLESRYEQVIRGRAGLTLIQKDAKQRRLTTRVELEPQAGATVELSLDLTLQHIAERELAIGIAEHRAEAGTVLIMDPWTGEIAALANYPTFNPNTPGRFDADAWKNRAIQDAYEPGSTFKIVTAAAALEEGVLRPTDMIDCSPGYIKLSGRPAIHDEHTYGLLSFEDVIVKSSNVGAIKAGLRVGADRFSRWVRRFGFGQGIAPDFAGESAGIVHPPASLDESGLASMAMGYQVSVTPMQMVAAVSAIANGGNLMEPHLVRAIVRDGVREEIAPRVLRRTMSAETAATITGIMEGVVERGTAKTARLDRHQAAGKTGTAKKAIPGGYSDTDRVASFVGFAPSRRPAYTILVVIDTPRAGRVYGGSVAAPIFKRIAEAVLREEGVPPTVNPEAPVLVRPRQRTTSPAAATSPVVVPAAMVTGGDAVMPDLRGQSARAAVRVMTQLGLDVRVQGTGVVVSQSPEPGAPLSGDGVGVIRLQRSPPPPGGAR